MNRIHHKTAHPARSKLKQEKKAKKRPASFGDTNPVRSLESAAPHQNSPKSTKLKEVRIYETHRVRDYET
jgi:hypothetical protein